MKSKYIVNAVNLQVNGKGVVPDHNIGYEGINIIERRDKTLEFGLNLIEKNANDR